MEYKKVSKSANKYILAVHLNIAIFFNILFFILLVIIGVLVDEKFSLVLNFIGVSFIILSYLWSVLRANSIINNYSYLVNSKKIEITYGALILSKKIMSVDKVFKIEIKRGILGRIFRVACIKFHSNGGSVKICYVDYEEVENVVNIVKEGMNLKYGRTGFI